jgi:hypothetical protein
MDKTDLDPSVAFLTACSEIIESEATITCFRSGVTGAAESDILVDESIFSAKERRRVLCCLQTKSGLFQQRNVFLSSHHRGSNKDMKNATNNASCRVWGLAMTDRGSEIFDAVCELKRSSTSTDYTRSFYRWMKKGMKEIYAWVTLQRNASSLLGHNLDFVFIASATK